jgi:hypothetical protein
MGKGGYSGLQNISTAIHMSMVIEPINTNTVSTPQPPQSTNRYQVIEYDDGFRIEGHERSPVAVRLSPNKTYLFIYDGDYPSRLLASLNMYAYPVLRDTIVDTLMEQWKPVHETRWNGILQWAKDQTRKALQKHIYAQWQRLLSLVPETKRQVAKAVFAATFDFRQQGCETWEEIYEHPFLVQDIIKYRTAAIACHYGMKLKSSEDLATPDNLGHPTTWRREQIVEYLVTDWKALFSSDGKARRNLCRMLMNLPGNIPAKLLCNLPVIEFALNRPVTDRIELLMLLNLAEHIRTVTEDRWQEEWYIDIIIKASRKDILTALQIVSSDIYGEPHSQQKSRLKKRDFDSFLTYIQDYYHAMEREGNTTYHGNLVGLARRSVRWHQEMRQRPGHIDYDMYGNMIYDNMPYGNMHPFSPRFDEQTQTALPPIPLPENPHITFLANVQAVYREGTTMQHCIASYAGDAVQGQCYLFHVDYQGTTASTMIDAYGRMVQSFGPHNVTNVASRYGAQMLGSWGMGFRSSSQSSHYSSL